MKPLRTTLCLVLAVAATVAVRADLARIADLRVADLKVGTYGPYVVLAFLTAVALAKAVRPATAGSGAQGFSPAASSAALSKYCITCHNQKRRTAGLAIDTLDLQRVGADAEVWEKIARKFRTHEMPPPGAPRPEGATYAAVTAHLENALDSAASAIPNPGRVPVHRLNRRIRNAFAICSGRHRSARSTAGR